MRIFSTTFLGALFALSASLSGAEVNNAGALRAAAQSIRHDDLKQHVQALADDTFEGREAGSRGGRAASIYLGQHFREHRLQGGGEQGYYQTFGPNYNNIIGRLDGSDPALAAETVIVSAHYDHVGYGTAQNSYGPTGYIHNGADDNASGVSGLLEIIQAFASLPNAPRRTILFALWDGEEKGLLGSKHWLSRPTVPLATVTAMVNVDMIGRLRGEKVEIYGTRTAPGWRKLLAFANRDTGLGLDCTWEIKDNSDHYPFYERSIPALMLHTGLHSDYHRPSDDVERIEFAGMERVSRLLFETINALANQDQRANFRPASRNETEFTQRRIEQPLPALLPRLGVRFDPSAPGARVNHVDADSPAAYAGIQPGDEIVEFAGQPVSDVGTLRRLIWTSPGHTTARVRRGGAEPTPVSLALRGGAVRLGITWRTDEAEPGALILTRVSPGTPAGEAGLAANDRLYQVNGQDILDQNDFRQRVDQLSGPVEFTYERGGKLGTAKVELPALNQDEVQASL